MCTMYVSGAWRCPLKLELHIECYESPGGFWELKCILWKSNNSWATSLVPKLLSFKKRRRRRKRSSKRSQAGSFAAHLQSQFWGERRWDQGFKACFRYTANWGPTCLKAMRDEAYLIIMRGGRRGVTVSTREGSASSMTRAGGRLGGHSRTRPQEEDANVQRKWAGC